MFASLICAFTFSVDFFVLVVDGSNSKYFFVGMLCVVKISPINCFSD